MKENKILEKIFFSAKIASGQALFPPLVKAKNQHQNFEKYLKQKRCAIGRLTVPNFCYFSKKIQVNMVKNVKTATNIQFFMFFTMLNPIFLKNNKSLEHLNVLLRIFFVSCVF